VPRLVGVEDGLVEPAALGPIGPVGREHPLGLEVRQRGALVPGGGRERLRGALEGLAHRRRVQDDRHVADRHADADGRGTVPFTQSLQTAHGACIGVEALREVGGGPPSLDDPPGDERREHVGHDGEGLGGRGDGHRAGGRGGRGCCHPRPLPGLAAACPHPDMNAPSPG
jgi:hypothetical protein